MAHTEHEAAPLTIVGLATRIAELTTKLKQALEAKGQPLPSFDSNAPLDYEHDFPTLLLRMQIADATQALNMLMMGPRDYALHSSMNLPHDHFCFYACSRYGLFEAVPLEGDISYTDLATKVGKPEDILRRILQHCVSIRVFTEPRPGYIAHNAFSALPVKVPSSHGWIGHTFEDGVCFLSRQIEAIDKYNAAEDPNETAAGLYLGLKSGETLFTVSENRGTHDRFGKAMQFLAGALHDLTGQLNQALDWEGLGEATVVDVGGSTGHISVALAQSHPKLHFVVQDLPALESQFDKLNHDLPAALKERVTFQAHDFFTEEPVKADVYVLKHILHDWSDKWATKIVQQLIPAMKPGARILLVESVKPPLDHVPQPIGQFTTSMDLHMLTLLAARERTRQDWETLLTGADKRLSVKNYVQPPGAAVAAIEVVFSG